MFIHRKLYLIGVLAGILVVSGCTESAPPTTPSTPEAKAEADAKAKILKDAATYSGVQQAIQSSTPAGPLGSPGSPYGP